MKAVQAKEHRFGGLYQLLSEANLKECFEQLRKEAAPGVDGVTYRAYAENLEVNIRDLVQRLKNKSYRAKLVRRQYIPKENGKMRPLGIPALEDKLLQMAVAQILTAIYEADFLPCSYGYRPGLGPHDAVEALTNGLFRGRYEFVVEADIKGFYDNIRHDKLLEMLQKRIGDGALLRLINKWLKAGILETTGEVIHPQSGTPQGGIVSPVLANVYLHYALDLWFEEKVRKRNRGLCRLIRDADDFVACFAFRHEAVAFQQALAERLKEYGLELAADKTKMLRFGRSGGKQNGRFDFLGFEFSWAVSRKGQPFVQRRTARKKLRSSLARFTVWVKTQRSVKVREVMTTLRKKLTGYGNYYGVRGNSKSLSQFFYRANRILFKWLNRRSQKRSYSWKAFNRMLTHFGIREPKVSQKPEPSCRQREMNLCDLVFRLASAWRV
jgi:RNA-directed DNA polymerase